MRLGNGQRSLRIQEKFVMVRSGLGVGVGIKAYNNYISCNVRVFSTERAISNSGFIWA